LALPEYFAKEYRWLRSSFIENRNEEYLKEHVLHLNNKIIRRVRSLKMILIDSARSGAHLTASSGRT